MPAAYLRAAPVLPSVCIPYWCAGKAKFESAALAAEVAARSHRGPRQHYRCSCGYFHVGASLVAIGTRAAARELIR